MLERATACLDTGARLSVRCARRASRSNRSLGSQFWNHGAGDPELSPWLVQQSSQTPPEVNGSQKQSAAHSESKADHVLRTTPEAPFLDFLYPPQALALLRRGGGARLERWDYRNERRLPRGFVHATRGYSSKTSKGKKETQKQRMLSQNLEEATAEGGTSNPRLPTHSDVEGDNIHVANMDPNTEVRNQETTADRDAFGSSPTVEVQDQEWTADRDAFGVVPPAEVQDQEKTASTDELELEQMPASPRGLREIMTASKNNAALDDPKKSFEYTKAAWNIYERLLQKDRDDVKVRFLEWLSQNYNEAAETHCLEVYHSIPATDRTMTVYKAALAAFVRSNLFGLAEQEHAEALNRLINGHELSIWLCSTAVENEMWDLASRVKDQLYAKHRGAERTWVEQLFWRQMAEMPDLLSKAISLSKHFRMLVQTNAISMEFQEFSIGMFKMAIIQEYTTPDDGKCLTTPRARKSLRDGQIRYLIGRVQLTSADSPGFFSDVLNELTESTSAVQYYDAHKTVSYMYRQYRTMSGVVPSQTLLQSLLVRLLEYAEGVASVGEYPSSLSLSTLREDWIKFYQKLNVKAYHDIMRYCARIGDPEAVEAYFDLLRQDYPRYEEQEPLLWTLVYVYARRGEIKPAIAAFEQINTAAEEAGKLPNLRIWNALLHAHSRATDLQGALATMERLLASGLKPNAHTFHPLTELYSVRGDVESVQDLLDQHDQLSTSPRSTHLYGSLMTAYANSDDLTAARNVLQEALAKVEANEVEGSLTTCFNILLTSLALARDSTATMRAYRWMKKVGVEADSFTYAALMQSLIAYRQTDAAWKILKSAMPENGLPPRAFHYAIVMTGFVRERAFDSALNIHKQMLRRNIKPTLSTDAIYAKAKALSKLLPTPRQSQEIIDYPVEMVLEEIEEALQDPAAGLAAKEPQTYSALEHQSPQALLFSNLIYTYGKSKLLEGVQVLMQRFTQLDNGRSDQSLEAMPLRILSALMPAYIHAERWDDVQSCWDLAKQQTDAIIARKSIPLLISHKADHQKAANILKMSVADTTIDGQINPPDNSFRANRKQDREDPSKPDPALRVLLSQPLRHYINALALQSRFNEMISTVAKVLTEGYVLDRQTWNFFIQHLLRPSPPLALLAFRLTEKYLIPSFSGWMRGKPVAPFSQRAQGLHYMVARYLRPNELVPRYELLVKLGAALLEIRRRDALGTNKPKSDDADLNRYIGTTKQIRQSAPQTVYAVQSMPSVDSDSLQATLLRREM